MEGVDLQARLLCGLVGQVVDVGSAGHEQRHEALGLCRFT
jgi:hypothetical protein